METKVETKHSVFSVRCTRCKKVVAPQLMHAIYVRDAPEDEWRFNRWECLHWCAFDRKPYFREILAAVTGYSEYSFASSSAMDSLYHRGNEHFLIWNDAGNMRICRGIRIRKWVDGEELPKTLDEGALVTAYGHLIYSGEWRKGVCP